MEVACPQCGNNSGFLEIGRATVVFPIELVNDMSRKDKLVGEYQPSRIYEESFEFEWMECPECGATLPSGLAETIVKLANGG